MRQRSRRPRRAYAAIPNAAMRDKRISIDARGLLALLMTYSDDWEFFFDHLQDVTCCGRDKLRGLLRELEAAGYVVRELKRGDSGRLKGSEWVIVDDPFDTSSCPTDQSAAQDEVSDHASDDCSRPPENPSLGTDPLKNRPPEKPTAGKSAPIRIPTGKKTKREEPRKPPAGISGDDGGGMPSASDWPAAFEKFWGVYPNPVEREHTLRAFESVLEDGAASPEELIEAALAYARSRHVERGYGMKPANWLSRGAWRDEWEPGEKARALSASKPVDLDALAAVWAPAVREGKTYAATAITAGLARHMVGAGLVTDEQLRRIGVDVR